MKGVSMQKQGTKVAVIFILLSLSHYAFADTPEITSIIAHFLESYNQLDGIELVGGPFEPNLYSCREPAKSDFKSIFTSYEYNQEDNAAVWPSHFSIVVHTGNHSLRSASNAKLMLSENVKDRLAEYGIQENSLPSPDYSSELNETISLIQVDTEGNIFRCKANVPVINKVKHISENNIVMVFYNETYDSSFFHNLLNLTSSKLFQRATDGSWREIGPTRNKPVNQFKARSEKFLLYGDIDNQSLLSLLKTQKEIHPEFNILAVQPGTDNKVFLYEGDLDTITSWLIAKPKAVAVYEKDEKWGMKNIIEIINVDKYCVDFPIHLFPLTSKLTDNQLVELKDKVKIESKLNEQQILELLHYAYRLRCISNNIVRMDDAGYMEVDIKVGSVTSGSGLRFKKIRDVWRITGYYEFR
jgi:hypothetical protein